MFSKLRSTIALVLILSICLHIRAQEINCDYFGLKQPGLLPKDFNPEILDLNGSFKFNVELSNCNEIYFTAITSSENIFVSSKEGNTWSEPKIASFSDPNFNDADPFLSPDGKKIYFISKRPTHKGDNNLDYNIWYADRTDNDWSDPKPLPKPINSDEFDEYMFSISDKGNAFFSSNRSGGNGSFDIYTVKVLSYDKFSEPKNFGIPLSTSKYEFDPYISPDERFIVFSINGDNGSDIYYSYKNSKGEWIKPKSLGASINVTNQDFAPSLSSDGKFIFFSNNGKLRWVSSKILNLPK